MDAADEEVRRVTFRARPTARAVRYELFETLRLPGEPPRHPSEFDRLLKTALAATRRLFFSGLVYWLQLGVDPFDLQLCWREGWVTEAFVTILS
ncbi:hypothetical protein [Streptomyces sp. NPDC059874]|uniref:hypothetical protein n=1 Tax=Streptomyces sp. NPDC059874 TaxID=3346983 RepID=UPI00365CE263